MIDVKQQVSAVERTVGSRVLEAGTARVATISQVYDTTIDDLWDAVTNVERIPRWFMPVSGDLSPGGHYQIEGNANGTVERCDKPSGFAATWEYGGEVSWIEARLTALDDERTRFELEHVAHVDDERWTQYGPGAAGIGWDLTLIGLFLHLTAGGVAADPEAVAAWTASDDGKLFAALSSDAWCEANIAAGVPEAVARASAARSTAFYTATP